MGSTAAGDGCRPLPTEAASTNTWGSGQAGKAPCGSVSHTSEARPPGSGRLACRWPRPCALRREAHDPLDLAGQGAAPLALLPSRASPRRCLMKCGAPAPRSCTGARAPRAPCAAAPDAPTSTQCGVWVGGSAETRAARAARACVGAWARAWEHGWEAECEWRRRPVCSDATEPCKLPMKRPKTPATIAGVEEVIWRRRALQIITDASAATRAAANCDTTSSRTL